MKLTRRLSVLVLVVIMCFAMYAPTCLAYADFDDSDIDSGFTVQSEADAALAAEKEAAANELYDLLCGNTQARFSNEYIQEKVEAYIAKYAPDSTYQYTGAQVSRASTDITNLNYTCYEQPNSYYCGPASAYILLKGMGKSGFTMYDLATDLGTTTNGTDFSGTWVNTLNTRANTNAFVATWNPGSKYKNDAYIAIVVGKHGFINDVHMVAYGNHLDGYASSSGYWHYVTADGIDMSGEKIHYQDPSKNSSYPSRYGGHWVSISIMQGLVADRGIIW